MPRKRTVQSPAQRVSELLSTLGTARSRDLEALGLSRGQIRRLLDQGLLVRVERGLYRLAGQTPSAAADLAALSRRVPGGVVCLLSALRLHDLATFPAFEVWLAIGHKAWRPRVKHPPLQLVFLSGEALTRDVEQQVIDGVPVPVFSAARTVADCFKFRGRLGLDVAVEALRAYVASHPGELNALWSCARFDRVDRVMQPYLDALG